jgi:hypothetical protein
MPARVGCEVAHRQQDASGGNGHLCLDGLLGNVQDDGDLSISQPFFPHQPEDQPATFRQRCHRLVECVGQLLGKQHVVRRHSMPGDAIQRLLIQHIRDVAHAGQGAVAEIFHRYEQIQPQVADAGQRIAALPDIDEHIRYDFLRQLLLME